MYFEVHFLRDSRLVEQQRRPVANVPVEECQRVGIHDLKGARLDVSIHGSECAVRPSGNTTRDELKDVNRHNDVTLAY